MAELAISVLGLASLFNNAIDWFEYIYIAKNFGLRLQTNLLKLDNAQLRLTRWGDAVGISGDVDDEKASYESSLSEDQQCQAAEKFRIILQNFEAAAKICDKGRKGKKEDDPSVRANEIKPNWDSMRRFLHDRMQGISFRRRNKTSLFRKAKFAIYDEKHLVELIDGISKLTDELYKLFPPDEDKENQLCKKEVEEFTESLRVLGSAAKGQDPLLSTAVDRILNQTVSIRDGFEYSEFDSSVIRITSNSETKAVLYRHRESSQAAQIRKMWELMFYGSSEHGERIHQYVAIWLY